MNHQRLYAVLAVLALFSTAQPAAADTVLTATVGRTFSGDVEQGHTSYGAAIGFLGEGVFGFEVEVIPRLQLQLSSRRTVLLDSKTFGASNQPPRYGGNGDRLRPMSPRTCVCHLESVGCALQTQGRQWETTLK